MPASEEIQDQSILTAESDAEEQQQEDYQKLLDLYDESMRNLTGGRSFPAG
jgi:hypothetical protein